MNESFKKKASQTGSHAGTLPYCWCCEKNAPCVRVRCFRFFHCLVSRRGMIWSISRRRFYCGRLIDDKTKSFYYTILSIYSWLDIDRCRYYSSSSMYACSKNKSCYARCRTTELVCPGTGFWRHRKHQGSPYLAYRCKVTGRRHRVSPCRSAYFASPWWLLTLDLRRRSTHFWGNYRPSKAVPSHRHINIV